MRLVQFRDEAGRVRVAAREGTEGFRTVEGVGSMLELASKAIEAGTDLRSAVGACGLGAPADVEAARRDRRLLPPLTHPDPAHLHLTGTGLTHLGSAATRDSMHKKLEGGDETLTDSMKMFRMGLEGGKPKPGEAGVQPEWFYKGNGSFVVAPGQPLVSPAFAEDAGEEPEIAGLYVIGPDGTPFRLGFALSNEFSDHKTERVNYLWLAHSKLRNASVGPELLVGPLPEDVRGNSQILRDGAVIWEKPFLSGEANMSHTIANLEHHHFKYAVFRQPGDAHIHMFGTATLSFADGIAAQAGDVFRISAPEFGLALENPLAIAESEAVAVRAL